jgi:GT2 family glycosyltransferase
VVIVSWASDADLLACVRSLADARGGSPRAELIVVDNGSAAFPDAELAAAWAGATVIRNPSNRGFGPAANQGAAAAKGDAVLFLNPDTRAVGDPLGPLVEALDEHPEAVAVAPRLLEGGGPRRAAGRVHQLRRLPTLAGVARDMLLVDRAFPGNRWLARDRYLARDPEAPFEVEQPAAAALVVRRAAFLEVGGFDEALVPAWFEDVDLCARLRPRGTILYWPASRFVHEGGAAAAALGYDRFLPIYYRNAIRFWRKHHGAPAALACRTLVLLGMVLRLVVTPLGARPPAPRGRAMLAYVRTLREVVRLGGPGG